MDPSACLNRLAHAIATDNHSESVAALNDYYRWRIKGGFQPPFGDSRADTLAIRLSDALARLTIA
jgi:hypothetical protein